MRTVLQGTIRKRLIGRRAQRSTADNQGATRHSVVVKLGLLALSGLAYQGLSVAARRLVLEPRWIQVYNSLQKILVPSGPNLFLAERVGLIRSLRELTPSVSRPSSR